jgi:hypothetical protein
MKPSRRRADSTEITCRWCNGRLWGLSRSLAARYLMARSPAAIEEFGGQAVVLKLMVSMMTARVKLGGAHRPVGEAGGGGAAYLEQGGRGAGGPLPRDPGGWLVKAALIGTKQIAPQHLTCPESPAGVELRAICDLSPATTEAHRVAGAPLCGPHRTGPPRRSGLSARPRTSSTSRASASGRSYLSDHMRCRRQPGWRLPVPHWHAIWVVGMASATVFRRATKVPSILIPRRLESRLKPLRFENRRLSDQARRPKPKLRVTL